MSDIAALIADMVRAGVDPELIGRTAATFADKPKARTAGAIRQERYRERNKPSQVTPSDGCDAGTPALDKEIPPTPPKEIKPSPIASVVGARAQFEDFWTLFPNKVGKRKALAEFLLALQRASFAEIMDGLRRYVAKVDDRPWCNPTTFLHQDRWNDQPAMAVQQRATAPPKKVTLASMWRDEGRKLGILDDPANPTDRRLEIGLAGGQAQGSNFARRITSS